MSGQRRQQDGCSQLQPGTMFFGCSLKGEAFPCWTALSSGGTWTDGLCRPVQVDFNIAVLRSGV